MRIPAVLALLGLPTALSGQVVRGVVRDSASGEPAAGVLIALVELGSRVRRTALTDESGQFTVAAPGAGRYALETKRIGVRPALTPEFTLGPGEAREFGLTVAPVVALLDAVRVTGRSYCGERVAQGAETATLWEEVRAALTATRITREGRLFPVTITNFKRTLDPATFEVRSEERREQYGVASNPFSSVSLASLSANGYVTSDGRDGLVYHAPDVDVLLSDVFVRDHCFRAVLGNRDRAGSVGLSFEPTSARRVPDIAGVLWIDARTRELRRLEYNYTGTPIEIEGRFPLSYVEFTRLPSGAWVVQRWAIRMPHVGPPASDAPTHVLSALDPRRPRLVAILEEGGEAAVGARRTARAMLAVEGTVFDSTVGRPLAGARVLLRGTPFTATSDAVGRFRLQVPDSGSYLLAFEHARLDTLGFDVPARPAHVAAAVTAVSLAVPPLVTVRAALCPGSPAGTGVIHGAVRNAAGAPAAWATLKYRWEEIAVAPARRESSLATNAPVAATKPTRGGTLVADSRGRYLVCDVPAGHYRLTLESDAGEAAQTEAVLGSGEIVVRELTLRRRG